VIGRVFDLHGTPKPSSVVLTLTSITGAFTLSELDDFIGIRAHAFCAIGSTTRARKADRDFLRNYSYDGTVRCSGIPECPRDRREA
jgi:uncharacterized protein YciI